MTAAMKSTATPRRLSLDVSWGHVDLDFGANTLLLTLQWCYRWDVLKGADPCTPSEMDKFHAEIVHSVRQAMHGVRLHKTARVGRKKQTVSLGLDVQIENRPESRQWVASVRRVPKDCAVPVAATMNPALRTISLTESPMSIRELGRVLQRTCIPMLVEELNTRLKGMTFLH